MLGRPDFVFPVERVAVFVDGCFWHGCPRHYTAPAGHAAFWRRKLVANRTRDRLVTRTLTRAGLEGAPDLGARSDGRRSPSRLACLEGAGIDASVKCPLGS